MALEYSEDTDWLEQFLRPAISPGSDLSGLDLDGRRAKQVSRSQCQKCSKSRLTEQTGEGTVMRVRELWGQQRGAVGTNYSRFLSISPNI